MWRQPHARNLSLEAGIEKIAEAAKRADRGLSRALEAWIAAAPQELADCCRPISLRAGTLEMTCDSSAAAYELNRWLQSDGVAALAREGVPILRVRLVGGGAAKPSQPKRPESGKSGKNATGNGNSRRPRS